MNHFWCLLHDVLDRPFFPNSRFPRPPRPTQEIWMSIYLGVLLLWCLYTEVRDVQVRRTFPGHSQDFPMTISGLSQNSLRIFSWISQDFLRPYPGLSQEFPRTFLGLSQYFLRSFSGLSQKFHRTFPGLSQDFYRTFSWISQDFLSTFSVHSLDFLRTFSGLSQDVLGTFLGLSQDFLIIVRFLLYHITELRYKIGMEINCSRDLFEISFCCIPIAIPQAFPLSCHQFKL